MITGRRSIYGRRTVSPSPLKYGRSAMCVYGWNDAEGDIENSTGRGLKGDFWGRGPGTSLVDLGQDLLGRTHHRRGPYSRRRYYDEIRELI
jgi:hypothetical protein